MHDGVIMSTGGVAPSSAPSVMDAAAPPLQTPDKVQETALTEQRNQTIDVIRFFAAASIVFVHAAKSPTLDYTRNLFRFAVPFYLFASLYFQSASLRRNTRRTYAELVIARIKRLYYPFLAWSVIYLLARNFKRIVVLHNPPVGLNIGLLWKGVEYHLWFLPFLLFWSVLLVTIHRVLLRQSRMWRWPLIVIAITAGLVFALSDMPASWDEEFDNPTYAYVQYWRATPAALWGLAFAWLMTMGPIVYSVSLGMGIAGIALTVGCSIQQARYGIQLIPRGLSGLGCMLAALAPWKGSAVSVLARLGRYSYGVYLCHILITELIQVAANKAHFAPSVPRDIVTFVLTFAGSLAFAIALGSSRRLAWLNG